MTTLEIIQLIVIAVVVLALVIYVIVAGVKNKWFSKLAETIKVAIAEAEQKWPEGHGDEKKQYVIEAVKAKCKELGIPYEVLYKLVNKLIDTIVEHYNVISKSK